MGDGQPERINRTLINMLKCLSETEKGNWKDHLGKLAFAYNATVNKSTGFAPFLLMFGREARLPIDIAFGIEFVGNRSDKRAKTYDKFVKEWREAMSQAVEIAKKHIKMGNDRNEKYYNKKMNGANIMVSDYVLLRNRKREKKGATGKLKSFWEDLVYEVVAIDPVVPVYSIRPTNGRKVVKRVHRNNIMCCNDLELETKKTGSKEKSLPKARKKKSVIRLEASPQKSVTNNDESSDDELVVVTRFSSEDEVSENIRFDVQDTENETEAEDSELVIEVGEEASPENRYEDLESSAEEDLEIGESEERSSGLENGENDSELESIVESEDNNAESSSSDSEPVRQTRPVRTKRPPNILTYEEIGKPSVIRR